MKVVTLCGSMRFSQQMKRIALELETKRGFCVLSPVGDFDETLSQTDLSALRDAHFKKIDLSDAVYIANIGGYIGHSVSEELQYAKEHNKKIIFHENEI